MEHILLKTIRKKRIMWKAAAFVLLTGAILAGVIFAGRNRKTTLADSSSTGRDYYTQPLQILEIVPYKGLGYWGYLVSGQEPIQPSDIEAAKWYTKNYGDYWSGQFHWDFYAECLTAKYNSTTQSYEYVNEDKFINGVLKAYQEDWNGKVIVNSVSANQLTKSEIESADLIVIQSDVTANRIDRGGDKTPMELYQIFKNTDPADSTKTYDKFYNKDGSGYSEYTPNRNYGSWLKYSSYVNYSNEPEQGIVSLDISWDMAEAILEHAFKNNKATIVSAGYASFKSVSNNMDRLIMLLSLLDKKSYVDDGVSDMIYYDESLQQPVIQYTDTDGNLVTITNWTEGVIQELPFKTGIYISISYIGQYLNNIKNGWRSEAYKADAEKTCQDENIRALVDEFFAKLDTVSIGNNYSQEEYDYFYSLFYSVDENGNSEIPENRYSKYWDALVQYAQILVDSGKYNWIPAGDIDIIRNLETKYENFGLVATWHVSHFDYDVLNEKYVYNAEAGNIIRYTDAEGMPFAPSSFTDSAENGKLQHVFEILHLGSTQAYSGQIRILEIEPCTDFRYDYYTHKPESGKSSTSYTPASESTVNANRDALAKYFGSSWTRDNIEVTSVTPDQLNAMTVDLVSEYDAIYIGAQTGQIALDPQLTDSQKNEYATNPYCHTGEIVTTETLINGLLEEQKMNGMVIQPGDTSDAGTFNNRFSATLTGEHSSLFLKNIALYKALGAKSTELPFARRSGNDITVNMKNQLQEFISSGQPVIMADAVYNYVMNPPSWVTKNVNLYNVLETNLKASDPPANLVREESGLTGLSSYIIEKPSLQITDARTDYIIAQSSTMDLTKLNKSNDLQFHYSGILPDTGNYELLIILDCNGDGVFDENAEEQKETSDEITTETPNTSTETTNATGKFPDCLLLRQDVNASGSNLLNDFSGNFSQTVFGSDEIVDELCRFRVIIRKKETGYPRMTWTGYMRPELQTKAVKILQVRASDKTASLADSTAFAHALGQIHSANLDYTITPSNITVTDLAHLSDISLPAGTGNDDDNPLSQFDLIILGFGYGTEESDISEQGLANLQKYVESGGSVIFGNQTISYTNMEAANRYTPQKFTDQSGAASYSLIPLAGAENALYPDRIMWNYNLTQAMRITLGMDRFYVTEDTSDTNRLTARDSYAQSMMQKQGFGNAALYEYEYPMNPQSRAVRADAVEKVNEGAIHSYPFDLSTTYSNGKMKAGAGKKAPYYQLDLERSTEYDDVTVWATLGGYSSDSETTGGYFDRTARDARNNYYLYSKNNIYYTGYELPQDNISWNDLTTGQQNEMKLFINTIYAALKGKTPGMNTPPIVVAQNDGNISLYQSASAKSDGSYSPNVYTCYYDEYSFVAETSGSDTKYYLPIAFRVQKSGTTGDASVKLVIGLTQSSYPMPGSPTISDVWLPQENSRAQLLPSAQAASVDMSAVPVLLVVPEDSTSLPGSAAQPSDTNVPAANTWYTLKVPKPDPDQQETTLNGKNLVIAVRKEDTSTTPDADSVYALITFVERELFDLD